MPKVSETQTCILAIVKKFCFRLVRYIYLFVFSERKCLSKECTCASAFLLDLMDRTVDPCENFYNFSCGSYEGNSTLRNAQKIVDQQIQKFIKSPITKNDSVSIKLQKKYFQACMNIENIESKSNDKLKELYQELGGWPMLIQNWNESDFDWGKIVQKCIDHGLYYDWFLYIENEIAYDTTNKNLHVRYLNKFVLKYISFFVFQIKVPDVNEIPISLKDRYVLLMVNVLNILGAPQKLVSLIKISENVVKFEKDLYGVSNCRIETKVY